MGSQIEKAKQQAQQQSSDINDFLDNSEQMLVQKNDNFVKQLILSGAEQKQIPISQIMTKDYQTRVSIQKGSKIAQQVTTIIGNFVQKQYAQAVGNIIQVVTNALIGSMSGSQVEERGYFIAISPIGAILRIDYLVYLKSVTSQTFVKYAKNFYLCSYLISSVDASGLTFNDLLTGIQLSYSSLSADEKQKLVDSVLQIYGDEIKYEKTWEQKQLEKH